MTTPEPEQHDAVAIERDDALLDAIASGRSVDDPAAVLLAEIAHAVEQPTSGGSAPENGGGRRLRTIWGVTLGMSVALALGGGLGVAAYGQFAPHGGAVASGFVVPAVHSPEPGFGAVTVTLPPQEPTVPFGADAARVSALSPRLPGMPNVVSGWPWELTRANASDGRATVRSPGVDGIRPLATTRWGDAPRTYSRPLPSYDAPTYDAPTFPTRTAAPSSAAPSGGASYVPTGTAQPTASPTGEGSPVPTPSTGERSASPEGNAAHRKSTAPRHGGASGDARDPRR